VGTLRPSLLNPAFLKSSMDGSFDVSALYEMAKAAADGAGRACNPTSRPDLFYESYGGYPAYVEEYNRLVSITIEIFGEEATRLFSQVELRGAVNPATIPGMMWRTYSELAYAKLAGLAAFLRAKLQSPNREAETLIDLIAGNLRPSFRDDPKTELEVQNVLEVIFRARGLDFRREKVRIDYSSKAFVPDFTFESADLALEVKLCRTRAQEKIIVDEINADILAYQTRYRRALFVIYDLGIIRDIAQFKASIEKNVDVRLMVIKK
jgi:hypothetical protein